MGCVLRDFPHKSPAMNVNVSFFTALMFLMPDGVIKGDVCSHLVLDTWYLCSTRSKRSLVYFVLNTCVPLLLNCHLCCRCFKGSPPVTHQCITYFIPVFHKLSIITCVDSKLIQLSPPPLRALTGSLSLQCHPIKSLSES